MIYFIRSGEFVKIGYSKDIAKRMAAIQIATPNKLHLLSSFYGMAKDEKRIHAKFTDARVRGEWFNLTDEIREFADRHNGLGKDEMSRPKLKYGDIVFIQHGKHAGKHGSIIVPPISSDIVTVGLRVRNTDWMHAFTISSDKLSMIQKATPLPL